MCQCGSPRGAAVQNVDLDTVSTGLQHLSDPLHARCTMVLLSSPHPSPSTHAESVCSLTRSPELSKLLCVFLCISVSVYNKYFM